SWPLSERHLPPTRSGWRADCVLAAPQTLQQPKCATIKNEAKKKTSLRPDSQVLLEHFAQSQFGQSLEKEDRQQDDQRRGEVEFADSKREPVERPEKISSSGINEFPNGIATQIDVSREEVNQQQQR